MENTDQRKEERKKHVPSVLAVGVKSVTSPFSAIFIIYTIPGVFIDRGLHYRTSHATSHATRSAIAKTPVAKYARNRVNENDGKR